jgi:hypothetical protein
MTIDLVNYLRWLFLLFLTLWHISFGAGELKIIEVEDA